MLLVLFCFVVDILQDDSLGEILCLQPPTPSTRHNNNPTTKALHKNNTQNHTLRFTTESITTLM